MERRERAAGVWHFGLCCVPLLFDGHKRPAISFFLCTKDFFHIAKRRGAEAFSSFATLKMNEPKKKWKGICCSLHSPLTKLVLIFRSHYNSSAPFFGLNTFAFSWAISGLADKRGKRVGKRGQQSIRVWVASKKCHIDMTNGFIVGIFDYKLTVTIWMVTWTLDSDSEEGSSADCGTCSRMNVSRRNGVLTISKDSGQLLLHKKGKCHLCMHHRTIFDNGQKMGVKGSDWRAWWMATVISIGDYYGILVIY